MLRGIQIQVNEPMLVWVTKLPSGLPREKEERQLASAAKKSFFKLYEKVEENKNGVKIESLPKPWDEIALHIIKYITCEGRNGVVHTYHFRMLHQLRHLYY